MIGFGNFSYPYLNEARLDLLLYYLRANYLDARLR
jgi:hypothetical protein